jgi:predicted secreted protein
MNWVFGIATYVVIWWVTIFAILPIGITPSEEDDAGHGAGAPANPRLLLKAGITTVVSSALWLVFYWAISTDIINFHS